MFRFLILDCFAVRIRIFDYLYICHSGSIAKLASFSDAMASIRMQVFQHRFSDRAIYLLEKLAL